MYSKADTHMHTTYSDGKATPQEMVEYIAAHTDMRVIAITDHDTAEGAFVAREHAWRKGLNLEVIIGQEVTTDEGDVVGLFMQSTLPAYRTAAAAINAIHRQGGVAIAVHPFSYWVTLREMMGVAWRLPHLQLDGVEIHNGFPTNGLVNPFTAWYNRRTAQLSEVGGSDSHVPYTVGQGFTWFPGLTAAEYRRAILTGNTSAAGSLWKPGSVTRAFKSVLQTGWPSSEKELVYAEELPDSVAGGFAGASPLLTHEQ